jgi:cytochrome P450
MSGSTTLATVKTLEPDIRLRAEALIHDYAGGDVVAGFASPLPVHTAALVFGIATADVETARRGSESLFSLGSADLTEDAEAAAGRDVVALQHLVAGYVRRRHADPADDLISDVVAALADGRDELTFEREAEAVGTLCSTLGAGHITTTDTVGNAVRLFLRHPDQWDLLRRRPDLVPNAVEEVLRFESPVPTIFRRTTRPATVGGVDIPADADVLLVFASAHRDEDRYADPERFDVTRTPSRHFGFGAGPHTCVGAPMARVQARVALSLLLDRRPELRADPAHPVRLKTSINVRGPLSLHLS